MKLKVGDIKYVACYDMIIECKCHSINESTTSWTPLRFWNGKWNKYKYLDECMYTRNDDTRKSISDSLEAAKKEFAKELNRRKKMATEELNRVTKIIGNL